MPSRDDRLREILSRKAHDLFAAYGVPCATGGTAVGDDEDQVCAILGFAGDHLRGSILVVATGAALDTSNPLPGGNAAAWAAELANQLVGRFKNELLRHGIEVALSIPVVLTATRVLPRSSRPVRPIHLGVGDGDVMLWLEIDGDAVLAAAPDPDTAVVAEGDLLMF